MGQSHRRPTDETLPSRWRPGRSDKVEQHRPEPLKVWKCVEGFRESLQRLRARSKPKAQQTKRSKCSWVSDFFSYVFQSRSEWLMCSVWLRWQVSRDSE